MRIETNNNLCGVATVFDDIGDLVTGAAKADPNGYKLREMTREFGIAGHGRVSSWEQLATAVNSVWTEGLDRVREMAAELSRCSLPEPTTVRRTRRWSENDGELDVDRVLGGEPAFFRESYRTRRVGCTTITVLCQVGASSGTTNDQLLWRGTATVATVDLLEAAGYSCDVWAWNLADRALLSKNHRVFTATRLKEAGEPVDIDRLAKGMSPWLYRTAGLLSYHLAGEVCTSYGGSNEQGREDWFAGHTEVGRGGRVLWVPRVLGKAAAVKATAEAVEKIESGVTSEV